MKENCDQEKKLLVRFDIRGNLRYLSHIETMRLFERAFVRAQTSLAYSKGFNPHPKMSVIFPRPVGVESEGDLVSAEFLEQDHQANQFKERFSKQLPRGIVLQDVAVIEKSQKYEPIQAQYSFALGQKMDQLTDKICEIDGRSEINFTRKGKKGAVRKVDLKEYIVSMDLNNGVVNIVTKVTRFGTIRVNEILELLGLTYADLNGSVKRKNIKWNNY